MNIRENIETIRQDFPILEREMSGHPVDYLDSCATTLKPHAVIDEVVRYYTYLGSNAHRGDYEMSAQVDYAFEGARKTMMEFIHASRKEEIVFTSGTTEGLNMVALMAIDQLLEKGDAIMTAETEHASSILPWQYYGCKKGIATCYMHLTDEGRITLDNFKKSLDENPNTKVVMVAQVSNVLGYQVPVEEMGAICKERGILFVVDGAQAVAHTPVDVQKMNCDFYCFSGHKMCGPTGIGVLYGRFELLDKLTPVYFGGESNARYYKDCDTLILRRTPLKYESGTQPIEAALGMAAAARYLKKIGLENIHEYELFLKRHFLERAEKELKDKVKLYNATSESGIITFNVYDNGQLIFPQDMASFLSSKGIAVRSGQHCAKLMGDIIDAPGTVRASLYLYNSLEDVDRLVDALKEATVEKCLDIFF